MYYILYTTYYNILYAIYYLLYTTYYILYGSIYFEFANESHDFQPQMPLKLGRQTTRLPTKLTSTLLLKQKNCP